MIEYLFISTCSLLMLFLSYQALLGGEKLFLFNRIFLLVALLFSLVLPFINVPMTGTFKVLPDLEIAQATHYFNHDLMARGEAVSRSTTDQSFELTTFLFGLYLLGVLIMGTRFFMGLRMMISFSRQGQKLNTKVIVNPAVRHPFSFFQWVFLTSEQQAKDDVLLMHESIHRRKFHSLDVIFIEFLMVLFWFQPLMYLYRKAIVLNHEYEADHYTYKRYNLSHDYFNKIIEHSDHHYQVNLASNFSYVSLKNRIKMMSKKQTSRTSRLLKIALQIMVVSGLFIAFAFETKPSIMVDKPFILLLDPGHGGNDPGAYSESGVNEKDINLTIANKLADRIKKYENIQVIMTRSEDEAISLGDRVAKTTEADLLVSLHVDVNSQNKEMDGHSIWYSKENVANANTEQMAKLFASVFSRNGLSPKVGQANFLVLREAQCPALLINMGFISNAKSLSYLTSSTGQNDLAQLLETSILAVAR